MTKRAFALVFLRRVILVLLGVVAIHLALGITPAFPRDGASEPERFTVETLGTGPDVILIPGLATPREVWRSEAERLAATHRVHLVQVRGFGDAAGANAQGPILAPLVDELADYVTAAKLDHPAIIGHSLGGLAALMLAADNPDLPGRVMIVDALPWYGVLAVPPGSDAGVAQLEPQAAAVRDQLAASYGKPADPAAAEANARQQVLDPANVPTVAGWIASADPRVMGQLAYDDLTTDMRGRLGDIAAPVTVVVPWNETYPTKDQAVPFYRNQYDGLVDGRFVGIGPSGHFVMLDQTEALDAAIDEFLGD